MIFNVQRFSTHDGDGIRTMVFTKGCSLKCPWCQNPESIKARPELLFDARLCIPGCEGCVSAAQGAIERDSEGLSIYRQKLTPEITESMREQCPAKALTVCGEKPDMDDLMAEIRADKVYYQQTGGGLTISGGEPFMQPELTLELARRANAEDINTAVETCLHVPWGYIKPALPYIDCFLADLKHTDPAKFSRWAGGSIRKVQQNLIHLSQLGKRLIIRVPVIPGFNDSEAELVSIIDFCKSLRSIEEMHFIPYHTLGIGKYKLLQQPYSCSRKPLNNPALLAFAESYAESRGLNVKLRG